MLSVLLLLSLNAAPLPENTVGTVVFQGGGRAADVSAALSREVPAALVSTGFTAAEQTEVEKQQRAAAMCGEDTECLATIGHRLDIGWILGLGIGAVGKQTMVTALLVDVATGATKQRFEAQRPTSGLDTRALAGELVTALFAGLSPKVALTPPPVVEPPPSPPPELVQPTPAPTDQPRPVRTAAIGFTVGAIASGLAGGGLAIGSGVHYGGLANVPPADRRAADDTQRALNASADVAAGVAIAAGVTAIILFVVDGASK